MATCVLAGAVGVGGAVGAGVVTLTAGREAW